MLDIVLPVPISVGSAGGSEGRTLIHELASGRSSRSQLGVPRRRFVIKGVANETQRDDLLKLFYAARGRAEAFKATDPLGASTTLQVVLDPNTDAGGYPTDNWTVAAGTEVSGLVYRITDSLGATIDWQVPASATATVDKFWEYVDPTIYAGDKDLGAQGWYYYNRPSDVWQDVSYSGEFSILWSYPWETTRGAGATPTGLICIYPGSYIYLGDQSPFIGAFGTDLTPGWYKVLSIDGDPLDYATCTTVLECSTSIDGYNNWPTYSYFSYHGSGEVYPMVGDGIYAYVGGGYATVRFDTDILDLSHLAVGNMEANIPLIEVL